MSEETIIHIKWEGPYNNNLKDSIVIDIGIYQIYGLYPSHNRNSLLYIGKTDIDFLQRLEQHKWIQGIDWEKQISDSNNIEIYLGKIEKKYTIYLNKIESLLIFAHKPIFNIKEKNSIPEYDDPIRILNWENFKYLMPEVSTLRWSKKYWDK
jgi:hypothetical protein